MGPRGDPCNTLMFDTKKDTDKLFGKHCLKDPWGYTNDKRASKILFCIGGKD